MGPSHHLWAFTSKRNKLPSHLSHSHARLFLPNPSRGVVYEIPAQASKLSRSAKARSIWEAVTAQRA